MITLDTTRADRLGCYGYELAVTPTLDRLSAEGVLFERAYAVAPLTLPSHASLFTGLYPPEHGIRTNGRSKFDSQIPHLASLAADAGYETGAFIGSFVLHRKFGLDAGFSVYNDEIRHEAGNDDLAHRERNGAAVVKSALAWLNKPRTKPFLCWVHLYDPHYPYQPHADQFGTTFAQRPYDAEVAYVDRQIGKLCAWLRESRHAHDTLILVVGDHGEGLGDHVEQQHGYTLYNSTQHVPLIWWAPGRIAPRRQAASVSLVDVLPTLCDLLHLPQPPQVSGRSLLPALEGKSVAAGICYSATDDPLLQEGWAPLRSLAGEKWKYVRTAKPELYDLESDPRETKNLYAEEPARVAEWEQLLTELEERMQSRAAQTVSLSDSEQKILQGLGYLGGQEPGEPVDAGTTLIDVKDMLRDDVAAREALELMEHGDPDSAIGRLKNIVERNPHHSGARAFLGMAYEARQDFEAAIASYEDALRVKPGHLDALIRAGCVHGQLGRFDRAVAYLDKALLGNPTSILAHLNLGRALFFQQKYDQAVQHLEEALRLDPEQPDVRLILSDALLHTERKDDAAPILEDLLHREPRHIPARLLLARSLSESRPEEAWQLIVECLQSQPGNPHVHFAAGEFLLNQRRPREALKFFQETRRLAPDFPQLEDALQRANEVRQE